ncbi:hypothetical protein Tco_0331657 [Tanacetum coccineum]
MLPLSCSALKLEAVVAALFILSPNSLWTASSPTFIRETTRLRYGYIKNHKKTIKNKQTRTRESEEYKKKPKIQSRSQKSQASVKSIKKKEKGAKGVFTIHPSLPNFTMVKREGKQELIGIKGNSSSLLKDSREKSVIPRLLIG